MANTTQFTNALNIKMREAIIKSLEQSAILVQSDAKRLAPFGNTGLLGNSIQFVVDKQNLTAKIFTPVKYAPYVEFGTSAHIIRPKNGKALAWGKKIGKTKSGVDKREFVYKEVKHPGTTEKPFMRPALDNNLENIKNIFAKNINAVK